jgi:hypothetical protein
MIAELNIHKESPSAREMKNARYPVTIAQQFTAD